MKIAEPGVGHEPMASKAGSGGQRMPSSLRNEGARSRGRLACTKVRKVRASEV